MKISPIGKRILGKFVEIQKQGAILLLEENEANKSILTVEAIGNDVTQVKVGDKVLISKYAGTELSNLPGFLMFKEEDVSGIFEPCQ